MDEQLTVYQQSVTGLLSQAEKLEVAQYTDIVDAADLIQEIKIAGESVEAHKQSITKPINESLKNIRAMFKPVETAMEQAEKMAKEKVLSWHKVNWEKGKVTNNTIEGTTGKVTVIGRMKVIIEDETKIPKSFFKMVLDSDKLEEALRKGEEVSGAYLQEEYSINSGKK